MKNRGIFCCLLVMAILTSVPLETGQTVGRSRLVPATLDLREHAAASINFLTRAPDSAQGMLPYFWTFIGRDCAELRHNHWDYSENPGRNLYGLIAARQITGSLEGLEAQRAYERLIYHSISPEYGLSSRPAYSPFMRDSGAVEVNLWDNRSVFMGLLSLYMLYGEPQVKARLETMIDGLERLAVRKDKYVWFENEAYFPGHVVDASKPPRVSQNSGGWITPLVKYWQVTGSERARKMAAGLANFIVDYQYTSLKPGRKLGISNVHGALFAVAGVIREAQAGGDPKHIAWAREMVDYASDNLASRYGWVMEMEGRDWMKPEDSNSCETCAVVDMLQCYLLLAGAGYPEYWDRAERYLRNYFTAGQMIDTSWMNACHPCPDNVASSWTDVPSRVRGCFVGWGAPNDLVDETARVKDAIQNCCGPHGAWGLFLAWRRIVTVRGDTLKVNLALNKETGACRVESSLPYKGKVEAVLYRDACVLLRAPGWVDRAAVRCRVDGREVKTVWAGNYVMFAGAKNGQRVTLEYPLPVETRSEKLDGHEYRVRWKGDAVVAIDPPGKHVPILQRPWFEKDEVPRKDEPEFRFREEIDRALNEIDW